MTARDVSASFQALMDRANRGREANIQEVETLLNLIHLTNDDIPAVCDLLDCLFAGIEDSEEDVDHYVEYLKKSLERLELRLCIESKEDELDAYKADRARQAGL